MHTLATNVYLSAQLPGFNNVASNREKRTAGVERKNKVRDRILPPVVRTVGLMKRRKGNMNHSSAASPRCCLRHETENTSPTQTITLVLLRFLLLREIVTISFPK